MWYEDQTFVVEAISFYRMGILLLTILVSIANSKQTILLLHIIKPDFATNERWFSNGLFDFVY